MMLFPDDQWDTALCVRLCYQALDTQHVRAGGIHTLCADLREPVQHLLALAVGADDDRIPRLHLLHTVDAARARLLQFMHHMGVVDDAAQHHAAALFPGRLLRNLYRPLHTVAKTGAFCLDHPHCTPPSSYT